jgi:hypothetical protein
MDELRHRYIQRLETKLATVNMAMTTNLDVMSTRLDAISTKLKNVNAELINVKRKLKEETGPKQETMFL